MNKHTAPGTLVLLLIYLALVQDCDARQGFLSTIDDAYAKPTMVIVHGAWGGSWAFREVEHLLREKGYDVHRPSLTGQGERVHLANRDVNLSIHIQDVVNVIEFEDLHDIILVGHSYGGMVISGVAHRIPERIQSLIYLDAVVPNHGESLWDALGQAGNGMMDLEEDGMLIPRWVPEDQPPPKDVPQSVQTFQEPVSLNNESAWQIPTTYIHAVEEGSRPEEDTFYSQAERARERGWPVTIIWSDHNPQWSAPEELVELLHRNW
jgi:pimeloyl-ACP methyl ester carboxylesterase